MLVLSGMGVDPRVWEDLYFKELRQHELEPVLLHYAADWFDRPEAVTVADLVARCVLEASSVLDDSPVLLGFSAGALIAQEIALRSEAKLAGLVLISPFARQRAVQQVAMDLEARLDAEAPVPAEFLAWLDVVQLSARAELTNDSVFRRRYAARLRRGHPLPMEAALFSAVRRYRREPSAFASIRCATSVISFSDDFMVPAACSREVAAAVPGSRCVEIEDAGHAGIVSHHRQVLDAIAQHFGGSLQGPRGSQPAAHQGAV